MVQDDIEIGHLVMQRIQQQAMMNGQKEFADSLQARMKELDPLVGQVLERIQGVGRKTSRVQFLFSISGIRS